MTTNEPAAPDADVEETTVTIPDEPTTTKHDKGASAWELTARDGRPHPMWWHPYLATAFTVPAGLVLDYAQYSNGTHAAIAAGAAVLGTIAGSACVPYPGQHMRPLINESAAFGAVAATTAAGWGWLAATHDLLTQPWVTDPWVALGVAATALGLWYARLRGRIARARHGERFDPTLIQRLATRAGRGDYEQVMEEAGFEGAKVVSVTPGHRNAMERVHIELSKDGKSNAKMAVSQQQRIATAVAKIIGRSRGITIPAGGVVVREVASDMMAILLDVQIRDVMTETITPDEGPDITTPVLEVGQPMEIGVYASGEPVKLNESGIHGFTVGSTGSGKSTFDRAVNIHYARRPHVTLWAAGTAKFGGVLRGLLGPWMNGTIDAPPVGMVGGGDGGTVEEHDSAVRVLVAAVKLMMVRMTSKSTPRDDGNNIIISRAHPLVIVQIDEVDDFIKGGKDGSSHIRFRIPGTDKKLTIPEMFTYITSKGRSEGVELYVAAQRTTDKFMGMSAQDFIRNMHRRAVFYTESNHDVSGVLGSRSDINPGKIPEHTFVLAQGQDKKFEPAKTIYYKPADWERAVAAAVRENRVGVLSGDEAAALGPLWRDRWTTGHLPQDTVEFLGLDLPDGDRVAVRDGDTGTRRPVANVNTMAETLKKQDGYQPLSDALARVKANIAAAKEREKENTDSTFAELMEGVIIDPELTDAIRAYADTATTEWIPARDLYDHLRTIRPDIPAGDQAGVMVGEHLATFGVRTHRPTINKSKTTAYRRSELRALPR